MSTEFNYVVNVDQSQLQSSAVELSSTMQMALARGMQGAQLQSPGMSMGDAMGGVASGFGMMSNAFARMPMAMPGMFSPMIGGTFTNQAMAYTPHWGMQQAETSLQQEWLVDRYGLGAAQRMKPPGVGAGEFAGAVERNFIDRKIEAQHAAFSAARTTVMAGGAGIMGMTGGAVVGGFIGKAIGSRFGMGGLGQILGDIGGGLLGDEAAAGLVTQHYAQIEQQRGIMSELGEIAGGGLGYSRAQRFGIGIAASDAARALNMDVQQMGDIISGARQTGMLPGSLTSGNADPSKIKSDLIGLARAIEDGAEALHTSNAKAMSMIKGMTGLGFGAHGGVEALVRMGAASGLGAEGIYGVGMAGVGAAHANLMSGRTGFDLFTSSVIQAAGAGMGREELSMLGGVGGVGQLLAMHQIQSARGPMGTVQSMAGLTGRGMSGDLYGIGAQALEGLNAGGDMLSNYVNFAVNQDKYAGAGGAAGIRARSRQQMMANVGFMRDLGIAGSDAELGAFSFIQQGYNPVQARALARMTSGGGGGGGGGGYSMDAQAAIFAYNENAAIGAMGRAQAQGPVPFASVRAALGAITDVAAGSPWTTTLGAGGSGASLGSMFGLPGTIIGGVVGLGLGYAASRSGGDAGELTKAEQEQVAHEPDPKKRQAMVEGLLMAHRADIEKEKFGEKFGIVDFDAGSIADKNLLRRAMTGDFHMSVLDLDAHNATFAKTTAGLAEAFGIGGADTGAPGTMRMGGKYYSIAGMKRFDALAKAAQHTATSRKAFESVRAQMTDTDASRAREMMYNFGHLNDVAKARYAHGTAQEFLARAGAQFAAHPDSPESRAIIDSIGHAVGMGPVDLSAYNPAGRRAAGLIAGMRGRDVAMDDHVAAGLGDMVAGPEGAGFLGRAAHELAKSNPVVGAFSSSLSKDHQFRMTVYEMAHATKAEDRKKAENNLEHIVSSHASNFYGLRGEAIAHQIAGRVSGYEAELSALNPEQRTKLLRNRQYANEHERILGQYAEMTAQINEDLLTKKKGGPHDQTHDARKRHAGMAENAIGFGAQESAMSHIERSLRATRSALEKLNSRIPGGTPVPPSQGVKTSG